MLANPNINSCNVDCSSTPHKHVNYVGVMQRSGTYGSSGDGIWLPDNFELKKKKSLPATLYFSLLRQITAEVMSGPFLKDVFVLLLN